ncbi:hypothetical protein P3760_24600, partial [Vibrio parahaemolyticus]|nr:hypothetical protein [Vibrio parahaemolyticus]
FPQLTSKFGFKAPDIYVIRNKVNKSTLFFISPFIRIIYSSAKGGKNEEANDGVLFSATPSSIE